MKLLVAGTAADPTAAWLQSLTEALPTIVWTTDTGLRITRCSGAALLALGVTPSSVVGRPLADVLSLTSPDHAALVAHRRALAGDSAGYEAPWRGRGFRAHVEPFRDADGTIVGVAGAAVQVVAAAAEPVPATLPALDRSAFLAALDRRMAEGLTSGAALVVLDLDDFGTLNARLGFAAGDVALEVVLERLSTVVRGTDLVARTGGDEFAILLHDAPGPEAERVAERLRAVIEETMELAGDPVHLGASAGVVRIGEGRAAQEVLLAAESAMLRAKAEGRHRCCLDGVPGDRRTASLRRVEAELRRALGRDDLRAHFEPTVSVKSGRVDGFEVLLWRRTARSPRTNGHLTRS